MWRRGVSLGELELLYRERGEYFVHVASAVAANGEIGRDAVQDAFAAAIRERSKFRGHAPLEAWVWRIVVNTARRYARERQLDQLTAAHEQAANGNGKAVDELGLRGWIAALPQRQREALFLRYYADLDYRQIAQILDVEVGTVSATLSAAHNKLRVELREVRQ